MSDESATSPQMFSHEKPRATLVMCPRCETAESDERVSLNYAECMWEI